MVSYAFWPAGLFWVALIVGATPNGGGGVGGQALTLGLEAPASVRFGTPVLFKVTVRNTSNRHVALMLGGRPAYDVVVTTPDGREVWRWSHGEAIQAVLERKTLEPGDALEFAAVWEHRDNKGASVPEGIYRVQGILNLEPPERLATEPMLIRITS